MNDSGSDPMPVFVLKGKDALAPGVIAYYRRECGSHDLGEQARAVGAAFDEMVAWQQRNWTLVKLPDHPHVPVETTPAPWRFDVPEVPAHVTALQDRVGWIWVREGAAWQRWSSTSGTVGAYRLYDADLIARAPLVECEDPRAAS